MYDEEAMIHPTALVEKGAEIGQGVTIGPYSWVGAGVVIGDGTVIGSHAVLKGNTKIGKNNKIFGYVSLGEVPQDKKYKGEDSRLEIGDGNTIREFCTFNLGTEEDRGCTSIGNDNWIMAYVHIAHDCIVGNNTVLANCTQLAGHVEIQDNAVLGGFTGIHQFCRVGYLAITGISSVVLADIPPFVTVMGNTAKPRGINFEGLKRKGYPPDTITKIKDAYKIIYRSNFTLDEAIQELGEMLQTTPEINLLFDFLKSGLNRDQRRSIVR